MKVIVCAFFKLRFIPGRPFWVQAFYATVRLLNGIIAQPSAQLTPDIALCRITPGAEAFTSDLIKLAADSIPVAMAGATGVVPNDSSDFYAAPLLTTNPHKSWLKTGSMVIDSADIRFNADEDKKIEMTTALGLTRKIKNKEQRIIVTGDADFMSNALTKACAMTRIVVLSDKNCQFFEAIFVG